MTMWWVSVSLMGLSLIGLSDACPEQCRCDGRKRVYCNNRNFSSVPNNIPFDTKVLHLQDNELTNSEILDSVLGKLTQLESLKLYNNKLDRIPKLNSNYLREVHFNKNRIKTISSSSLENAPNLSEMILDDNDLSNAGIESGAFNGLRQLRRISLIRNKLTEFPTSLPTSINELYLTQNQISYISSESLKNLINLEILYLDRNKLHDGSFLNTSGFESLINLRMLELSYNIITHVPTRISITLEELHITANQLQYLRRSELDGLYNLRVLDMAYNRLRSIERGTLEGLKNLDRVDLSGNNWSCDCYLRDLKHYLRNKGVHHGSREMVTCSDPMHSNDLLDSIQESQLVCQELKFNISEAGSKIKIQSGPVNDQPPFAQYRLLYRQIGENSTMSESVVVNPPIKYTLSSNLKSGETYFVCLYNSYIYRNIVDIPTSSCQQIQLTSESESDLLVISTNQNSANIETIIGLVTGALIVIMTLSIVTLLCWRNKTFSKIEKKYQSPIVHRDVDPRSLIANYPVTTSSTSSTNFQIISTNRNPEMTMDASKEFDVTLMLRQPDMDGPLSDYTNQQPIGKQYGNYQTIQPIRQPPDQTNRNDDIGVFV